MHAFLTLDPPLISASADVLVISPQNSIGIDEVRQILGFLSRKPIQSPRNTVVIHQAHLLTIPAQNALLKTLEEPPADSLIYLVTRHSDLLLPTILSRIQLIKQGNSNQQIDGSALKSVKELINRLTQASISKRLEIIDQQKFNRDSALRFLEDLEHLVHHQLDLYPIYPLIQATRRYLMANASVRLALDHFALNL